MKASTEQTRFGAVGVPDVQTELPQSFTDRESPLSSPLLEKNSDFKDVNWGWNQLTEMRFSTATSACTISIDIIAPDDTASWYDLWAAAVALDGMCARGGRTGKSRFLGRCGLRMRIFGGLCFY